MARRPFFSGDYGSALGSYDTAARLLAQAGQTQGAAIAYTLEEGDEPRRLLYHQPVRLPMGKTRVRAQAIRIGYKPSEVAEAEFVVR